MDTSNLTIRVPVDLQPFWCVCHLIHDGGPVAAVVWWDDDPVPGFAVDAKGVIDSEPVDEVPAGWSCWVVGDTQGAAHDPRQQAPNITVIGDEGSPDDALSSAAGLLAEAAEPTWNYEESLSKISQSLWRTID